jgi:hypothetical protein
MTESFCAGVETRSGGKRMPAIPSALGISRPSRHPANRPEVTRVTRCSCHKRSSVALPVRTELPAKRALASERPLVFMP